MWPNVSPRSGEISLKLRADLPLLRGHGAPQTGQAKGARYRGINPPTAQILRPNVFQVLVINDCEPPAPPSNLNIQGTIVFNQPASPTPVVVATPRFTG